MYFCDDGMLRDGSYLVCGRSRWYVFFVSLFVFLVFMAFIMFVVLFFDRRVSVGKVDDYLDALRTAELERLADGEFESVVLSVGLDYGVTEGDSFWRLALWLEESGIEGAGPFKVKDSHLPLLRLDLLALGISDADSAYHSSSVAAYLISRYMGDGLTMRQAYVAYVYGARYTSASGMVDEDVVSFLDYCFGGY